jgi:hypothetical protein
MKADKIYTSQTIRIYARIRDINGVLTNPQSIQFELQNPNDTEYTTYTGVTVPTIKNESTGIYYIDLDVVTQGKYKYSWFTYGNVTSSWKSFFEAEDARYP